MINEQKEICGEERPKSAFCILFYASAIAFAMDLALAGVLIGFFNHWVLGRILIGIAALICVFLAFKFIHWHNLVGKLASIVAALFLAILVVFVIAGITGSVLFRKIFRKNGVDDKQDMD